MKLAALGPATALLLLLLPLLAGTANADRNDNARLALHVTAPTTKNQCTATETHPDCQDIETEGLLYPAGYFVYVLVTNGHPIYGISGLQLGVDYDGAAASGVDILGWTLCATMNFPSLGWPADGTGNLITWDSDNVCQRFEPGGPGTGVVANAGYFYVSAYSPDQLRIIPRPADGYAKVADCEAFESIVEGNEVVRNPSWLGYASFSADGMTPGYSPCSDLPPSPISCSIEGPASLTQYTNQVVYTASSPAPGATFTWTLSGNAMFSNGSGMVQGPQAIVNSLGPGSFTLHVAVSASGQTSTCSKTVAVTALPQCQISGPDAVVRNTTGYVYTVSSSSAATFLWSIQGNGTIVSPNTGTSVEVSAGPGTGGFTLRVTVTAGEATNTCLKIVAVLADPTCEILGNASLFQGETGHYTLTTIPPGPLSHNWSVTGNGTLTSPPDSSAADVLAGAPGSFVLSCAFEAAGGLSGTCATTVGVQSPTAPFCFISGPAMVLEGSSLNQYTASSVPGASFSWSISGNGTITTATTGLVIRVTAGSVGYYTLTLVVSAPGFTSATCSRFVTVSPTPPSTPGLNNNAKVMVHVLATTTKNACTRSAAFPECNAVVTHGELYPTMYFAHVLMNDGYTNGGLLSGISGIEFGIDYNGAPGVGVDIYSWHPCGDSEVPLPGWPGPGTGNRVLWDQSTNCQRLEPGGRGTGVVTTPGYFYMAAYTPDQLRIVPPAGSAVQVADCQDQYSIIEGGGVQHFPSHLGLAGFGGATGYNPCELLLPTRKTTWSDIKSLYR